MEAVTDVDLELTERQSRAVDLLAGGMSDTDVAAAIGVHRATVNKWRHEHEGVRAALSQARAAAHRDTVNRVRRLQMAALEWAETELRRDGVHAHRIALAMLGSIIADTSESEPMRENIVVNFTMD